MVQMSRSQERVLENLQKAKETYDHKMEEFEAQVRIAREVFKQPIRDLLQEAEDERIPVRRRHLALGFQQVGPYLNWLTPSSISMSERVRLAEKGAGAGTFKLEPEPEPVKPEGYTFGEPDPVDGGLEVFYNGESVGWAWKQQENDKAPWQLNIAAINKHDDWDTLLPILHEKFGTERTV